MKSSSASSKDDEDCGGVSDADGGRLGTLYTGAFKIEAIGNSNGHSIF